MITFKQHIEISKKTDSQDGFFEYISSLSVEDRILFTRDMEKTYPLNMSWNDDYIVHERFNVYTDVMELVLGQFIMIEQIITGKTTYSSDAENDFALAQLLIRPKEQKEFDNEDNSIEEKNKDMILNLPVSEVYSILNRFLNNREFVLFKQFKGVFYELPEETDEDEEIEINHTGEALFQQQWYWYSMVRMLAQEDIRRYAEIYMLKMSTVMPEMSYLAQRGKIESAKQRQSQALSKL